MSSSSPINPDQAELDTLIEQRKQLEQTIANQPHRRHQLAKQLHQIITRIEQLQGQSFLF
jgi:septal ring factor EnvC (AmiA/AmiB activator)